MPVLRSERTYPLALTADPLNTGIVAAYDLAAEDGSTATSNGKDHSGNSRHYTPLGSATIVTTAAGKGRDTSLGRTSVAAYYDALGPVTVGLNVGTGDFSIYKRIRTPSFAPVSTTLFSTGRIADSGGNKIVFGLYAVLATGAWHWHITLGATTVLAWNTASNPAMPVNTDSLLHITRTSGVVKCYVNGILLLTTNGNTTDFLSTTGSSHTIIGNYGSGNSHDTVSLDETYWNRGLTDTEVAAHAANPYSFYVNAVAADTVTVTTPANSATVSGASFPVSGTYAGGSTVALVEASFNGGAYQTIDAAPAAGAFSGTMTGQTAGTGTLTVRSKNGATVVATATVTGVVVVTDAIAFTTTDTVSLRAVPYRMYQRDGSNQASVRITGTYTGAPTTIQYSWAGGAWTTLIASPAGGTFDQSVTLQGPGQGDLSVRFSNSTTIAASLASIGVGDIWITAGQSNHVGKSTSYVQPTSPAANPAWKSVKYGKNGVWALHQEASGAKYDDGTGAVYAINVDPTPEGSYFGALATKIMNAGVPVAFVPVAKGSTSLAGWAVSTSTTTLYGAMIATAAALGGHKGVLWWQGENETTGSDSQATHAAALNALVSDWFTRTGKKFWVLAINAAGTGANFQPIHDAIMEVGQTNLNCGGYADLNGSFAGNIHYGTVGQIEEIATRVYNAITIAPLSTVNSWTEGSEAVAMAGTAHAPGVNADLGWTEGSEIVALGGTAAAPEFSFVANWAEGSEVVSLVSSALPPAITSTAAWTEGGEAISIGVVSAAPGFSMDLGWTEGSESVSLTGSAGLPAVTAAASWVEGLEIHAAMLAGTTSYTRAPVGGGYRPRRVQVASRPAATQRNNR